MTQADQQTEALLKKLLTQNPNDPKTWTELSAFYISTGKQEHAIAASSKALELDPSYIEAFQHLGNAYLNMRLYEQSIKVFQEMLKLEPENSIANWAISYSLYHLGRISEVYPYISITANSALKLKVTQLILGTYYLEHENNLTKALACFNKEIELDPQSELAYGMLGVVYSAMGEPEQAIEYQKKQIEFNPYNAVAHNNLIMHLHYSLEHSPEETLVAANNFYKTFFPELATQKQIKYDFSHLDLSPTKPNLNIGFVSGDFKKHALFFWLRGLFADLNKESLKIFCYCNNIEDEASLLWKEEVYQWTNIKQLNDKDVAELIKKDRIDILVDLSGHTALNRLGLFAQKPSPVQVTWLGQTGPMGLPQIDYMISDPYLVFEGEENQYIEKVFRLPKTFAPFTAPDQDIPVLEAPCKTNGYITFGSFNNFLKINKYVLEAWAELLLKFTDSKLLIKSKIFCDEIQENRIMGFFKDKGIKTDRLILEKHDTNKVKYLEAFNRIDISIDPFPLGGGTTTHDTLWMSTPIINIKGGRMSHRISSSILHNAGFPEFVVNSKEEYINKAISLAMDKEAISNYKKNIRQKYLASCICDTQEFARDLENSFREMWHSHNA
jgi:protein O-GlcNAc transferase